MGGIMEGITETKVLDIQCPDRLELFGVEFNPTIDGSFYHAVKSDETRIRGTSTIHGRYERSLKCPYCGHKFVQKGEWK